MAFELPIQPKALKSWLDTNKIVPSEDNIDGLASCVGQYTAALLKKILIYAPVPTKKGQQKTIQACHILAGLDAFHREIPKRSIQQSTTHLYIPASAFKTMIKAMIPLVSKYTFRWSIDATKLLHRAVEWLVRQKLADAKQRSDRNYGDTRAVHSYL